MYTNGGFANLIRDSIKLISHFRFFQRPDCDRRRVVAQSPRKQFAPQTEMNPSPYNCSLLDTAIAPTRFSRALHSRFHSK